MFKLKKNSIPLLLVVSRLPVVLFFSSSALAFIAFSLLAAFSAVLFIVEMAVLCRISCKPTTGTLQQTQPKTITLSNFTPVH